MRQFFGCLDDVVAGVLIEHTCSSVLLLGVACLDVHGHHKVEEPDVLGREFVGQAAVVEQLGMAVGVARVVVVGCYVVGLEDFLDGLVAEEGNVELMACLVQVLGCAAFFAGWLCEKPLGFSCILPFKREK